MSNEGNYVNTGGDAVAAAKRFLMDPKTWMAIVIFAFTTGTVVAVSNASRVNHDKVVADNNTMLGNHISTSTMQDTRITNEMTGMRGALEELVRLSKINCMNSATDNRSRMTCVSSN